MENADSEGRVSARPSEPAGYFVPVPNVAPSPAATSRGPAAGPSSRRPRRPGRVRRVLRSRAFVVSVVVLLLAAAAAGVWGVQRVRAVEAAVAQVQSHSAAFQAAVTAGDDATARSELDALQSATARARALTSGTAWGAASYVPFVGGSVSAAQELLSVADDVSHQVLPPLQSATQGLGAKTLDDGRSAINLAALAGARDDVAQAQAALAPLRARLAEVPASGLIGPIGDARATLAGDLDETAGRLRTAGSNLSIAVPMLGGNGPRNYLILLQDPALAAGPGGEIVAYAVVNADQGQLNLVQVGGTGDLPVSLRSVVSSPDFPDVAQRWVRAWGDTVDGAITLDTVVLSDLLSITGPATLADGTTMYSADRIQLSPAAAPRLRTPAGRSTYVGELAHAALDKVLRAGAGQAIIDSIRSNIDAGRIRLASTRSPEEQVLAAGPLGGAVPRTERPFAYLSVSHDAGLPLDRWLDRAVTYAAGPCSGARRQSTITVRLTNKAPAHPPVDWFAAAAGVSVVGDDLTSRLRVGVVATSGAQVIAATLDGQPVDAAMSDVAGHPVATTPMSIPRGQGVTLRLTLDEPTAGGAALVPVQPLVLPQQSQVDVPTCPAG